jgi:hypothetical protein
VAKLSRMNRNPDNEPHFVAQLLLALGINAVVALIAYYAYVRALQPLIELTSDKRAEAAYEKASCDDLSDGCFDLPSFAQDATAVGKRANPKQLSECRLVGTVKGA